MWLKLLSWAASLRDFFRMWYKSDDVIVTEDPKGRLVLQRHGFLKRVVLTPEEAQSWLEWTNIVDSLRAWPSVGRALVDFGFINRRDHNRPELHLLEVDSQTPQVNEHWLKWYRESQDLCVLFNTSPISSLNPLLVLSPYGSLVWNEILAGSSVGHIRHRAYEIFGVDAVCKVLLRLSDSGFITLSADRRAYCQPHCEAMTEFHPPDFQFSVEQSRVPWYCLWEVNWACDLRCLICYLPGHESYGLEPALTEATANRIVQSGALYVSIFGGEPLLRSDLENLVSILRKGHLFVKIITNGQKLSIQRAVRLAHAGLNMVEVSFDGLRAETHDMSRGRGAFARSLSAVTACKTASIPRIGVVFTIHNRNIDEISQLEHFLDQLAVKECYISLFRQTGKLGSKAPMTPLGHYDIVDVRSRLRDLALKRPDLTVTLLPTCTCGRTSVVIGHDACIRSCPFSQMKIGNVLKDDLSAIWHRLRNPDPSIHSLGFCTGTRLRDSYAGDH